MQSSSRLVIVHPPVSVARDFIDYPYFANLGAVQLASVLERALAADVRLVDAYALPSSTLAWREDGRAHLGAPVADVLAQVRACEADAPARAIVVACTPFHRPPHRDDVLAALLEGLRALTDAPVVLADCYQSGQHYVEAGDAVLAAYPECDAWVKYEAEVTLPALLSAFLTRGERPQGVHVGASPGSLDDLPFPAWHKVDLDAYYRFQNRVVANLGRGAWAFPIDGRTLPLVTSRGCPFTCVHCSSNPGREPGEPKTQRRYGHKALAAYLTELATTHRATRLEVLDELVNVSERHFDAFLDTIDALDVLFDCPNGMRADYLEPHHLAKMRGRVATLSVSAESGNQRVVTEVVHKKLDLQAIVRAAQNAHGAGVPLMIHFMIGLPGETAEEINDTLAFALDLWDRFQAFPALQFATPLPGTDLARGRALPVVHDWGPFFQTAPSQPGALVTAETLRRFKHSFDERLNPARRTLVLDVTYACNNRCAFCAVGAHPLPYPPPAGLREALASARAAGADAVEFDGGEPTLSPDLVDLVRHARALGYRHVTVTTNGRLCAYEEFAGRLVRSGLTRLVFSVHGPDAAAHGEAVGVPEAFGQALEGIRHAVRLAPAGVLVGMATAVTRANLGRLDAIAQLAFDLGLGALHFQGLTPSGPGRLAPAPEEAAAALRPVLERWKERLAVQVHHLPPCFFPGDEALVAGDPLELHGHTTRATPGQANLATYLAASRTRLPACGPCPRRVGCGGLLASGGAPEPAWLAFGRAPPPAAPVGLGLPPPRR